MEIKNIILNQRLFFNHGTTRPLAFRKAILKKIKAWIINNEKLIQDALIKDLNKHPTETYMCEIGLVLSEINDQLKHLSKWNKPKKVPTPLAQFYGRSFEVYEPYGVTLVISPWNYPFLLALSPAIGAIAAGNTAVIKPSEYAPHVASIIKKMIDETCDAGHVDVIEGGIEVNTELLNQRFDYIFFTGSVEVGKIVMAKASQYLTPVTLELGGKSPCIVDDEKILKVACRRIAFGKCLNAGQTCVAPDYILIREDLKEAFIQEMITQLQSFFGTAPLHHPQLGRIISQKHFHRLTQLLQNQKIVYGGNYDLETLKIEPTLVDEINDANCLMHEEIFGPILPIMTYHTIDEAIKYINVHEKPLALYLFSNNKDIQNHILNQCSFGGGCINDTTIHLASNKLGFGGVGYSGMGSYHGKKSFETFSHTKSIIKKATWIDLPMRYYPYKQWKDTMIRLFLK